MAAEEEVELRDLVAHTLESKGVLGKIRAQLRASVFLALEEQESQEKPHPLVSSRFQQYLKTKDGELATALVREFLSYFELDYTCSVFDPETNALETYPGRDKLASDLGLNLSSTDGPLLSQLLHRPSTTTTTTTTAGAVTSSDKNTDNATPLSAIGSLNAAAPPTAISSISSLNTATPPNTITSLYTATPSSITTAVSPLDTVTVTPSFRTASDSDRQPFSTHQNSTTPTITASATSSIATGTTSTATTAAIPRWGNSDGISQSPENVASRPANSLIDALLSPGGGGDRFDQGGSQRSGYISIAQEEGFVKDNASNSGLMGGGAHSKSGDVIGNSRDSIGGGGGSGPPKSRSISLTPQVIKPSTNGMVGNGETAGSSKPGSTWQGGLHHANYSEDKSAEDSPISEDLSNNEENTDDFFGTKSSRGELSNKVDYSYEDDFDSENSKSETKSKPQVGIRNKYEETEDCSVSESSFGTEVDFMEPVKS